MEDYVYLCSWSRSSRGFAIWVKSRPHVRADADTYAEAEEHLIDAIQRAGGAMCAVLEFDPPLPKSAFQEKYSIPELYLIHGDDRFETDAPRCKAFQTAKERDDSKKYEDQFFESPVCRKCGYATGRRNEKPLFLTYAPSSRFDGGFGFLGHDGATIFYIVSQKFIDLLTTKERKSLMFRPVLRKRKGRSFFEVVGPAGPPFVAVLGIEANGWWCTACCHRVWGYGIYQDGIDSFVARSDLPKRLSGVFTVGNATRVAPRCDCGPLARVGWQERHSRICQSITRRRARS